MTSEKLNISEVYDIPYRFGVSADHVIGVLFGRCKNKGTLSRAFVFGGRGFAAFPFFEQTVNFPNSSKKIQIRSCIYAGSALS